MTEDDFNGRFIGKDRPDNELGAIDRALLAVVAAGAILGSVAIIWGLVSLWNLL